MERYQALFRDMLQASGITPASEADRDIDITIADLPLSLSFELIGDQEQVALSARIGKVPQARELEIYRLLLEANVNWSATRFATLGVNSATMDVVICYRCDMDGMTGESLGSLLSSFAEVAKGWREIIVEEAAGGTDRSDPHDDIDMLTTIRV